SCARVVYERIIPPFPLGAQTARPFRANHVNRITSGASALRSAGRLRRRDERLNGAGTAGPKDSTIESSTADGVLVKNWQSGLRSAESRTKLKLEALYLPVMPFPVTHPTFVRQLKREKDLNDSPRKPHLPS
ncbi:unnamed protein product, partial [Nesidiocoris tenuis]